MAKLKARGQKELYRLVKNFGPDLENNILESKVFYAIMYSGKVLRKSWCKFGPTKYSKSRIHDSGWVVFMQDTNKPEVIRDNYISTGFRLV